MSETWEGTTLQLLNSIGQAFFMSFSMLWPLILGFTLSGIVQAVVSHNSIAKMLGGDGPKSLTFATLFGIASSSCSYAAVALARSIFRTGASFTCAMAFEIASTNLVIELGIIPTNRNVVAITEGVQWNYTGILNIIFLVLAAMLVVRFIRTGGIPMLKMMGKPAHEMHHEQGQETQHQHG
jgi:uncharacterized protein